MRPQQRLLAEIKALVCPVWMGRGRTHQVNAWGARVCWFAFRMSCKKTGTHKFRQNGFVTQAVTDATACSADDKSNKRQFTAKDAKGTQRKTNRQMGLLSTRLGELPYTVANIALPCVPLRSFAVQYFL